jgi:hypothetical protein
MGYDSVTVCEGEMVSLKCDYFSGVTYKWSSGENSSKIYLLYLTKGRYIYSVEIEDYKTCKFTVKPFVLKVNPRPDSPIIKAASEERCVSDKPITIAVSNPSANHLYKWSSSSKFDTLKSITIKNTSSVYLDVKNEYGCITLGSFSLQGKPDFNGWLSGCRDICFPEQLCIKLDKNLTYQLMRNDTVLFFTTYNINTSH